MFLIARRQMESGGVNQVLMYMSLKFINGIWVLAKVKVQVKAVPGGASVGVSPSCYNIILYCNNTMLQLKDRKYFMQAIIVVLSPLMQLTLKMSKKISVVLSGVKEAFSSILHNNII